MKNGQRVTSDATGQTGTVVDTMEGGRGCGYGPGCCDSPDMVLVRFDDGSPDEWLAEHDVEESISSHAREGGHGD